MRSWRPQSWEIGGRLNPDLACCYAFYFDGNLGYIGQTGSLKKRLRSYRIHRIGDLIETPWGTFSSVLMKVRPSKKYGDWAMIELRLIKRLQPPFNCAGSVRPRLNLGQLGVPYSETVN
jgi:excinuclease UvrABC nuclease subunit